jgi:hypothetical protein
MIWRSMRDAGRAVDGAQLPGEANATAGVVMEIRSLRLPIVLCFRRVR